MFLSIKMSVRNVGGVKSNRISFGKVIESKFKCGGTKTEIYILVKAS